MFLKDSLQAGKKKVVETISSKTCSRLGLCCGSESVQLKSNCTFMSNHVKSLANKVDSSILCFTLLLLVS